MNRVPTDSRPTDRGVSRAPAGAVQSAPLSIAFVRQKFAADGGAERFLARTLESLKGDDIRATLIARDWSDVDGVETIQVRPFYLGRLWRDWSFARAVAKLLKARRFDVVQSHERIAGCDVYRAGDGVHREWLRQRARVLPWWGRVGQALSPYHYYVKSAERRVFTGERTKAVICNSKMVKEEIRRYFGIADDKLHVIYNGVDLSVYHPSLCRHRDDVRRRHGIPNGAMLFLFVGSGFERKGLALLLAAMRELPAAYLIIVGRDKKIGTYRRRAAALGLGNHVIFAGVQPEVKPYYGAADVLVLPTLYDPFPNVVIEALAAGMPVITSTKSGGAELIEEGLNGAVVDALDVRALVGAMRRLSDPRDAERLRRGARATAERFDLSGMNRRLRALYAALRP